MQLPHTLLQSGKKAFLSLNNQKVFFTLFKLALPTINRLHGHNSIDASCKPFVHESSRYTVSFGWRSGGDINDDKFLHCKQSYNVLSKRRKKRYRKYREPAGVVSQDGKQGRS